MKRFLTILIAITVALTFSFGICMAYAAEDNAEPEKTQQEEVVTVDKVHDVKAKAKSSSSIKVSWDKVKGATGYKVYRYNKDAGEYKVIKTVKSGKTTAYTNKGLKSYAKKTYKVQAYKKVNGKTYKGKKSAKASAKTHKSGVQKLMSKAESKLGCPYVSGAAGPNAFDCSGFVYYVYKHSGASKVKFSRGSAQSEYSALKKYDIGSTSLSKAKKGDILFFGSSKGNIWHTGIYYGGGKEIHAFSTWGKVSITPVSMSTQNKKLVAIVRLPMKN